MQDNLWEGKDEKGYAWVKDERNENYYYLKDFEHLIVMKVGEMWEAVVFEDETCRKVRGRQAFSSEQEAKRCLEEIVELSLKKHSNKNLKN